LTFYGHGDRTSYGDALSFTSNTDKLKHDGTKFSKLLHINSNGDFGIGTTSPDEKLHVNGNRQFTGFLKAGYDTNTTSYCGRSAIGYTGHTDYASFSHIDRNSVYDYALLQSSSGITYLNCNSSQYIAFRSGNVDRMRMLANGNFGIGYNSPSYKLHVNGTVRAVSRSGRRFVCPVGVPTRGGRS